MLIFRRASVCVHHSLELCISNTFIAPSALQHGLLWSKIRPWIFSAFCCAIHLALLLGILMGNHLSIDKR